MRTPETTTTSTKIPNNFKYHGNNNVKGNVEDNVKDNVKGNVKDNVKDNVKGNVNDNVNDDANDNHNGHVYSRPNAWLYQRYMSLSMGVSTLVQYQCRLLISVSIIVST